MLPGLLHGGLLGGGQPAPQRLRLGLRLGRLAPERLGLEQDLLLRRLHLGQLVLRLLAVDALPRKLALGLRHQVLQLAGELLKALPLRLKEPRLFIRLVLHALNDLVHLRHLLLRLLPQCGFFR